MIIQTKQQRKNTLEALNVMWPSVPARNVSPDLVDFRKNDEETPPDCKTIACFGGWCAWWPGFVRQGVSVGDGGKPVIIGSVWASDAAQFLFGCANLFSGRGGVICDDDFHGSNHRLVTRRLQWLLENSRVSP